MMAPGSERLERIWRTLCDDAEAALLLAMPATAEQLAASTGQAGSEVQDRVQSLFLKGVVFESAKPQGTVYRAPRHLFQLHDASIQWSDAPAALIDEWKQFMNEEYPQLLAMMLSAGLPSFMRAIPALGSLQDHQEVLAAEDPKAIIEAAEDVAVCSCPCRLSERNCDNTPRTCLQLDKGARYAIKRGSGERISKQRALEILGEAAEAGLVHMVDNKAQSGSYICNCCPCCCVILKPHLQNTDCHSVLAPSRYQATVEADECLGDEVCQNACPTNAVKLDDAADVAVVDEPRCIGCGVCVLRCPSGAITLEAVRPAEAIGA